MAASSTLGDPHSAQGDGEVDGPAIEHSLIGSYFFISTKDNRFHIASGNAAHHILVGINVDLNRASRVSV
jgi:acetamidase/formamidase